MTSNLLDHTFAALSDPTRRAMLARLSRGEASVKDLARPFRISGPAVTKHLKVLQRAGLITRHRHGQWQPCRLRPEPLREAAGWIEHYRQLWEQSFDRLEAYLAEIQAQPAPPMSKKGKRERKK